MPIDKRTREWIKRKQQAGYSDQQIKRWLVDDGRCTPREFDQYINQRRSSGRRTMQRSSPGKEQYDKSSHPKERGERDKPSSSTKKVLRYSLLVVVVLLLSSSVYSLIQLDNLQEDLDTRTAELESNLSSLESDLNRNIEEVDNKVDERFTQTSDKISNMQTRIDERFAQTNAELSNMQTHINDTQTRVNNLSRELNITISTLEDEMAGFKPIINDTIPSILGIKLEYFVNTSFGIRKGAQNGSGVVVGNGTVITNKHVVTPQSRFYKIEEVLNSSLTVEFHNGRSVSATVKGRSNDRDLAVLSIPPTNVSSLQFGDSDRLKAGQEVVALGNPLGFEFTATKGIISKVERELEINGTTQTYIQTDVAIGPGSSGGALLDSNGNVVGITTLKVPPFLAEGLGFAIPSTVVIREIEEMT